MACPLILMLAGQAHAQVVQRSFINLGFETPRIGPGTTGPNDSDVGCSRTLAASDVPGWESTEDNSSVTGFWGSPGTEMCPQTAGFPPAPGTTYSPPPRANAIQLFYENYMGSGAGIVVATPNGNVTLNPTDTPARNGEQFAELNADSNGRLYQRICMVNGEQVTWRLSHRGRASNISPDVMQFNIGQDPYGNLPADTYHPAGSGATRIVTGSTTTTGTQGSGAHQVAWSCNSAIGTCTRTPAASGWVDYAGTFVWNGGNGIQTIGFEAVSSSWGLSGGNYLDDIQVTLKPYLQFAGLSTLTYTEGQTNPPTVNIQVVGVVPAGGFTLPLTVTGTASSGSDYTLTSTITIPAGDFGEGTLVNVPLTFLDDTVIENNETLILTIPDSVPSSPYVLAHTEDCGAEPNNRVTINLYDNDIDLLTDKSPSTDTPLYGTPFTYTVTFTNRTAPTTSPATSHDVTTAISDPVPAGLTFSSWTCAASGTAGTACPGGITSGSGAISGNAVLPAGGTVTYTVTATLAGRTCDAISNTSTISVPAGFTEGTSVQSGYNSPPPTSSPSDNNTASASVTPRCTNLRISKTNTATTNHLDAPSDTLQSGQSTTYTLLVENGTPAVTGAVIRDVPGTGITCPAAGTVVTCTGSGSACTSPTYPMSDLTGAGITLGTLPANGSVTMSFTCTVN